MDITITARHTDIGDELKKYAQQRLSHLEHIWNRPAEAHFILAAEKRGFLAEINLHVSHRRINCRARNSDLGAAIDQVIKKAETRLQKLKGKVSRRRRKRVPPPSASEILPEDVPRLIKLEDFELETLNDREASLRMRASNLHFFIYREVESKKVHVIYRRNDGNLGLIELEK